MLVLIYRLLPGRNCLEPTNLSLNQIVRQGLSVFDTVESLILDLLEWIGPSSRPYAEVIEAWRTSCPRLPVWEDANERGLLERHTNREEVCPSRLPQRGGTSSVNAAPLHDGPRHRSRLVECTLVWALGTNSRSLPSPQWASLIRSGGAAGGAASLLGSAARLVLEGLIGFELRPRFGHNSLETGQNLVKEAPLKVDRLLGELEA